MSATIGSHLAIKVKASCNSQDDINTLHYVVKTGADFTLASLAVAFQSLWQAQIVPLVCDIYHVVRYEVFRFDSVIWSSTAKPKAVPPVWPHVGPRLRWAERYILAADVVDDKGTVATAELPSYAAINGTKVCGPITDVGLAPLPAERLVTGKSRFSGVPEASTDDATGNVLNAAAIAAWQAALTALVAPTLALSGGNNDLNMEVWSQYKDGSPRQDGAGDPQLGRAEVSLFTLESVLTTQRSRKQAAS